MRQCVAAFIVAGHRILLGKRSATRMFYPDIWDVFGGHQKPNESRDAALRRELLEELGIVPTRWKFLLTVDEPNPLLHGAGQYHFYLVTAFDGEPQNLQPEEHAVVEWFEFEQTINLPFAHPLYAEVITQISKETE
ncbi:MAG: NUDIX hydrolase [Acidobacteria bacterium]|nr:NUDIX hydrolase [Acidobacteriota bacterium]MBA3785413.1 NUDIX hydrolase [Acidobacteriota bacterium]